MQEKIDLLMNLWGIDRKRLAIEKEKTRRESEEQRRQSIDLVNIINQRISTILEKGISEEELQILSQNPRQEELLAQLGGASDKERGKLWGTLSPVQQADILIRERAILVQNFEISSDELAPLT